MSALNPIFSAIYSRLTGDATLMAKITGVFDFVPESQAYPYVVLEQAIADPFVTYDRFGESVSLDVYVFSQYRGFKEVNDIMSDIQRLLANQFFSIAGYDPVACFFDNTNVDRANDGDTRIGISAYRIMVQKQ